VPPRPRPSGSEFLRKLKRRGLASIKLVISDAHEGIKAAVARPIATADQTRAKLLERQRPVAAAQGLSIEPLAPPANT
jgi:hypothetical protein